MDCDNQNDTREDYKSPYEKSKDADKASDKCQTYLKNAVNLYEDRRIDLDERQKQLSGKIAIMEKSIPALMALNMLNCAGNSETGGVERVREMMKKLSPLPDPTDELVAKLTLSVEELNREIAELHDKIISADVQLEETQTELESLELENCELDKQIQLLENKLGARASLHSITSDDRFCMAKIRKLGEEEIRLKQNICDLEKREEVLRKQVEQILGPDLTKERMCEPVQRQKHHVHRPRSRRKKCCQLSDTSLELSSERSIFCCNIDCKARRRMLKEKKNSACRCQKRESKSCHKKVDSTETLTQKCDYEPQERSKKQTISKNCKRRENVCESPDSPWCTPEMPNLTQPNEKGFKTVKKIPSCEQSNKIKRASDHSCIPRAIRQSKVISNVK